MRAGMRFIGKPFSITGHTSRKGFWRFLFFYAVVVTVLALAPFPNGLLVNTSALALTLLLLLAGWRRLRDAGMSGWLVLLPLVPVAGALALIGLLARPATGGTGDAPETSKSIVRGALQGWLEIARFCGAVLGYLVLFIRWMGQAMDGPITQFCRRCHCRMYPTGALYCDRCLLDVRWEEDESRDGPTRRRD